MQTPRYDSVPQLHWKLVFETIRTHAQKWDRIWLCRYAQGMLLSLSHVLTGQTGLREIVLMAKTIGAPSWRLWCLVRRSGVGWKISCSFISFRCVMRAHPLGAIFIYRRPCFIRCLIWGACVGVAFGLRYLGVDWQCVWVFEFIHWDTVSDILTWIWFFEMWEFEEKILLVHVLVGEFGEKF